MTFTRKSANSLMDGKGIAENGMIMTVKEKY